MTKLTLHHFPSKHFTRTGREVVLLGLGLEVGNGLVEYSQWAEGSGLMYRMCVLVQAWSVRRRSGGAERLDVA